MIKNCLTGRLLLPLAFGIIALLVTFLLFPHFADARQGCCSHHGGVCGCRCCDGKPLSATCAPYYPNCNRRPAQGVFTHSTTTNTSSTDYSWLWWVGGVAVVGGLIYQANRRQ